MEARKSIPSKCLILLLLLIFLKSVSGIPYKIPRLTPPIKTMSRDPNNILSSSLLTKDLKTYFYKQTLDHFNYGPQSYATIKQKYVINFKYWGGANSSSPIFAYLGAESPLADDLQSLGFLSANAPHFKALQVYIEHRYYGKSVPFGTMEEAMKNESTRGYFNSAQAIADYAELLIHIKEKFSAQNSPIIVIGASYGGMLASWFRLKYPHIALGALAASAPILYFDNITPQNGYYSIVTKDFKEENFYQNVSHLEDENRKLVEQLDEHKVMVENANGEIGRLSAEVEQEKTKYSNTKEKLSLAGWERRL
ncbi:Serine carboxypeptidase S28 family protein [Forsythia ovata]|uniref:Serine carboxypeptidase S28 family protein n=1 Tax=Forsythia ovata TaxID=205694 RepID=A0ABD1T2S6_9LAMI